MEKNILKYLLALTLAIPFCKPKITSDLQKISNNLWRENSPSMHKDNVLTISLHRKTKTFNLYWIKFRKKPYIIQDNMKNSIEIVDDSTVFLNKFQKKSNDYERLIKKGVIAMSSTRWIDDSLDGYLYISKFNNQDTFKLIPLVDYFETLHSKRILLEKKSNNLNIEELLFEEVAYYFWTK